jgi:predicted acyl esterase
MQPPANLYDDVIFPGGIQAAAEGDINSWPPVAELLSSGAINAQQEYAAGFEHPTFDAWWQDRSLVGRHAGIKVPVLTIGGWIDNYFRSGTLTNIEGALDRTWAIYGQWTHMPPVDTGNCDTACVEDPLPSGVLLAWFDRWVMELKDVPIPEKPTFVSFEGPKAQSSGWRELSAWVPEGTSPVTYHLSSGGALMLSASAGQPVSFREPSESNGASGAATFTTEPLDQDHVLLGRPVLDFRAKLSASDANFYVELFDVDQSNRETLVNDGFLKASHRKSHTTPEPVKAGESTDFHIEVRAQHYRFAAGHRVRLRLTSGLRKNLVQPDAVDVAIETGSTARLRMPGFAAKL